MARNTENNKKLGMLFDAAWKANEDNCFDFCNTARMAEVKNNQIAAFRALSDALIAAGYKISKEQFDRDGNMYQAQWSGNGDLVEWNGRVGLRSRARVLAAVNRDKRNRQIERDAE